MNRADKHLLDDVLAEDSNFRGALLAETLRLARRRRQIRQVRRISGVFAAAFLISGLFWLNWSKPISVQPQIAKKNLPLPAYQLVRTRPLLQNEIVTTESSAVHLIASAASVVEIETKPGNFRRINDAELLALVANRPAILIRTGPNSEKLIFANPAEEGNARVN